MINNNNIYIEISCLPGTFPILLTVGVKYCYYPYFRDGETMEPMTSFLFLGSKITADGDCSHEIKRCLLLGVSLVAQRLKHLPAMWETWVHSLGREDPLEKEMATHSSILAMDEEAWWARVNGVAKSQT